MKFDKKALQRELDLAAEELEKVGYSDLALKVDKYNSFLMEGATKKHIPAIRRSLARITREAKRRFDASKRPAYVSEEHAKDESKKAKVREFLETARKAKEKKVTEGAPSKKEPKEEPKKEKKDLKASRKERLSQDRLASRLKEILKKKKAEREKKEKLDLDKIAEKVLEKLAEKLDLE